MSFVNIRISFSVIYLTFCVSSFGCLQLYADSTASVPTARTRRMIEDMRHHMNPENDGWKSEAVSAQALKQIKSIGSLLASGAPINPEQLQKLVSNDFTCDPLRPESLQVVFEDGSTVVRRARKNPKSDKEKILRGAEGLMQSLQEVAKPMQSLGKIFHHEKIVTIDEHEHYIETTALVDATASSSAVGFQMLATWHCRWELTEAGLLLASIRVKDYEEVVSKLNQRKWFIDRTHAVLGNSRSYAEQLRYGLSHWTRRVPRSLGMNLFSRYGLAVGDVNGDLLDDLYICQPSSLPNRLFVQQADGTLVETSAEARVDWLDKTSSALFVDLDNDGDQDLVVATPFHLLVMANDGSGNFELKSDLPIRFDVHALSAADFDSDGDLDIFVTVGHAYDGVEPEKVRGPLVFHDANNGAPNSLFRNEINSSDWKFTDVTEVVGLDADNDRHSLAAAWEDFDNDRDQDLYVANDYGRNCLYRNENGKFVNVAEELGVVDFGAGMSVSWGDYNRDGLMDLYVGNMFSSAGNRIVGKQAFKPGADDEIRSLYQRFVKGNSLFVNEESGFVEVGDEAEVQMARWAWSSLFVDINNDGWDDIFAANGYITNDITDDL